MGLRTTSHPSNPATPDEPPASHWLDAFAFSSLLAGGVAGSLTCAATLAFALPFEPRTVALAITGTLVVYNIDRLRDLKRDRSRAPLRSAFIERNRGPLGILTGVAAVSSAVIALQLPPAAWLLCGLVLALGLLHRRLKRIRGIKTLYLTSSWLAVVLGLPLLSAGPGSSPQALQICWVAAIVGCSILANLMASNLDRWPTGTELPHPAVNRRLGSAIVVAGLGVGFALVAPAALRGLAFLAAAELLAVSQFRAGERYGELVIDGALLAGACGAAFVLALARG